MQKTERNMEQYEILCSHEYVKEKEKTSCDAKKNMCALISEEQHCEKSLMNEFLKFKKILKFK